MSMPAPTPAPAPAPGGEPTPTPAPPAPEFKALTSQEELDRIVEGRLAREREKFKGFDDFKAKAEKWDQYEASQKTPDQKAIDEARDSASSETTQKFLKRLVSTETKAIAATLGFNDPADALQVINESKLPVKDEEPDTEEIKKLVEKLATDKPYLVTTGRRGPAPKQKPREGEPVGGQPQKGRAAAALRQLGASRGRG